MSINQGRDWKGYGFGGSEDEEDVPSLLVARRQQLQQSAIGIVLIISIFVSWLITSLNPDGNWKDWAFATDKSCEINALTQIKQPVNAWSSFSFILVGVFILTFGKAGPREIQHSDEHPDPIEGYEIWCSTLGGFLCLRGCAGWLYHSSLTLASQYYLDVCSHLIGISVVLYLAYLKTLMTSVKIYWWSLFLLGLFFGVLSYLLPYSHLYLPAIWWPVALTLISWIYVSKSSFFASMGLLTAALLTQAIGFLFFMLDYLSVVCAPTSLFQGNAVWSVALAGSFMFTFLFLRSHVVYM